MSNLSELLPTGGGQNAVDFVASGTLSSGQPVVLNANGTVGGLSSTTSGSGSVTEYYSTIGYERGITYDSANNVVVTCFRNSVFSDRGGAFVGTVSSATPTSISWGSEVVYDSSYCESQDITYDANTGKVVIAYRNQSQSNYLYAVVGTVSGTSLTFGTPVQVVAEAAANVCITYDSTAQKVVIIYRGGSGGYGTSIVGTVSGTSISFGTKVIFRSAFSYHIAVCYDSTSSKIIPFYTDNGNADYGTAIVGTVSGTSISFGTAVVYNSAFTAFVAASFDSTTNKIILSYTNYGSGLGEAAVVIGTVSGTSISFGSATYYNAPSRIEYKSVTYDPYSEQFIIYYSEAYSGVHGKYLIGTVSGTTVSLGSSVQFYGTEIQYIKSVLDTNLNTVVTVYLDRSASNQDSILYHFGSTNLADFIGITAEAISDTATGPVNVCGGINEAQTGLTIGSDYYFQNDGSISTTSSAVKIGQAISATTINIMDLT